MDHLQGTQIVEAARSLGHDIHSLSLWPRQPAWPLPVLEGFDAAGARSARRRPADRFQRKWLQLRLQAWQRRRAVADDVTPELLRQLDVPTCPVTREPLTHGERRDSDWSVDRLNNDGAYAAGNLAVLSTRVNRAKGRLGFETVLASAQRADAALGLEPRQWLRLAVLMVGPAYADRHELAPNLPLCAPLPVHAVRLAIQQVQRLLTLQAARPAGKNALVRALRPACRTERALHRLRALADVVHEGLKRLDDGQECWDVWLQPRVMDALILWRESLDPAAWAMAAAISGHLAGGRRFTPDRLRAWCLPSHGYIDDRSAAVRPSA